VLQYDKAVSRTIQQPSGQLLSIRYMVGNAAHNSGCDCYLLCPTETTSAGVFNCSYPLASNEDSAESIDKTKSFSMQRPWCFLPIVLVALGIGLLWGCDASEAVIDRDLGPAALLQRGKEALADEDYPTAQRYFDIIRLQYPASEYADDAQFYLGETYFAKGEYIMASYNYQMVVRNYPQSPWVRLSAYKAALCYYRLSPEYYRDQRYTLEAIRAFNEFVAFYPEDSLADSARVYIIRLRGKLAEKDYETAELYLKMADPEAALIYFDQVIRRYPDTHFAVLAARRTLEVLVEQQRYAEAFEKLQLFQQNFPEQREAFEVIKHEIEQWRNRHSQRKP